MDKSVIAKHYEVIAKHYKLDVTQLGMTVLMLGALRSSMGHEHVRGTVEDYIHTEGLSDDVRKCVDFLEREVLGIKKSRMDIDFWKIGNRGQFRRDHDRVKSVSG